MPEAKEMLSPHGLLEVKAGSFVLAPSSNLRQLTTADSKSAVDKDSLPSGGRRESALSFWEIVLLVMACAIFLGGLIAVVTVCSLRYKRLVKTEPSHQCHP